jgi:transposase
MDIKGFGMAGRKRRSWINEDKRTICQQTIAPGVSVAQVARRYALNANQIFNWLKDASFAPSPENTAIDTVDFPPIDVCDESTANCLPSIVESVKINQSNGCIEIALSNGHRLTVEGSFEGDALARLLKGNARNSRLQRLCASSWSWQKRCCVTAGNGSKYRPVVVAPKTGPSCARKRPNRSLMIWKHGCMRSYPKYPANRHWPKQSAMR